MDQNYLNEVVLDLGRDSKFFRENALSTSVKQVYIQQEICNYNVMTLGSLGHPEALAACCTLHTAPYYFMDSWG